jgi:hypothetical protein
VSESGKILIEIPDVPEAAMYIYESCFAKVDQWKKPESIFFPGLDENMHEAVDAWVAGMIITDNPPVAANGSEYEVVIAKEKRDQAFEIMEKIQSISRYRS